MPVQERFLVFKKMKVPGFSAIASRECKTLRKIKSAYGEHELLKFLYLIITDTTNFFNVGKNMTSQQIEQTAELILQKHPGLSLEDLKLCFNNGKSGEYGKQYDRIDGAIIFDWIDKYLITKQEWFEHHSEKSHSKDKNDFNNIYEQISHPDILLLIKDISDKYTPEKHAKNTIQEVSPEYQKQKDLVNGWIKEFDELYKTQIHNYPANMQRFVWYNGKNNDINSFILVKYDENLQSDNK